MSHLESIKKLAIRCRDLRQQIATKGNSTTPTQGDPEESELQAVLAKLQKLITQAKNAIPTETASSTLVKTLKSSFQSALEVNPSSEKSSAPSTLSFSARVSKDSAAVKHQPPEFCNPAELQAEIIAPFTQDKLLLSFNSRGTTQSRVHPDEHEPQIFKFFQDHAYLGTPPVAPDQPSAAAPPRRFIEGTLVSVTLLPKTPTDPVGRRYLSAEIKTNKSPENLTAKVFLTASHYLGGQYEHNLRNVLLADIPAPTGASTHTALVWLHSDGNVRAGSITRTAPTFDEESALQIKTHNCTSVALDYPLVFSVSEDGHLQRAELEGVVELKVKNTEIVKLVASDQAFTCIQAGMNLLVVSGFKKEEKIGSLVLLNQELQEADYQEFASEYPIHAIKILFYKLVRLVVTLDYGFNIRYWIVYNGKLQQINGVYGKYDDVFKTGLPIEPEEEDDLSMGGLFD